jgi:hypothetical protein
MKSIKCILLKTLIVINSVMVCVMVFNDQRVGIVEELEDLLLFIVAAIVTLHLASVDCSIKEDK